MATRVFELLILLYSGAEMTMTSLSKFFIADMLKKQLQQGNDNNDDNDDGAFGLYNSTTAVPVTIAALLNLSEISDATSHLGLTNLTSMDADHSGLKSGYHGRPTEEEEWGQEDAAELQRVLAWYLTFNRIGTYLPWVMVGPIFGRWTNRLRCKPQLAFPCVLYVLSALTYVLQPYVGASLLVVVLVSTLLVGACGKHAMFTTVLCNTLADRIPPSERSARFASVLAFNYMGTCVFTIAGGALTEHIGVANTLMVSSANHFACILLVVFAIKETDKPASRSAVSFSSSSSTKFSATSSFLALERLKKIVLRCFRAGNANKERRRLRLKKAKGYVSSDEKETTTDDEEDFQDRGFHVSLSEMEKLRPLANESQENTPPLTQSERFVKADDALELTETEQDVSVEAEDRRDCPETRRLLEVDGHEDRGGDKGKALGTRPEPGKRKVVLVVLMATCSFMHCLWASQLEIIVQTISVPPMNWPGSWYGYMFAGYYGSAGVGLLLLAPLITRLSPRSRNPDVILFTFGVVTSPVASVWMGVAASRNSDWQVFAGVMLAAMGMTANSALQAIISRCAGAEGRAEAMAAFFVMENFAKALGPLLHTVVYVVSQPSCPLLVYYVMSGEGVLLVAMAVWVNCHFGQVSGHSGL